jgi:hypothetical protein
MEFSTVLILIAKTVLSFSVLTLACGFIFLIVWYYKVANRREVLDNEMQSFKIGIISSLALIIVLFFVYLQYSATQTERHEALRKVQGISADLDKEVVKYSVSRITFEKTNEILNSATEICIESTLTQKNNSKNCYDLLKIRSQNTIANLHKDYSFDLKK